MVGVLARVWATVVVGVTDAGVGVRVEALESVTKTIAVTIVVPVPGSDPDGRCGEERTDQ